MPTRTPSAARAATNVGRLVPRRATARASAAAPKTARVPEPDPAEIGRLAYSYWEQRGGQGGSAEEDWLRAEDQLRRSAKG
jgi:hypothetical protein